MHGRLRAPNSSSSSFLKEWRRRSPILSMGEAHLRPEAQQTVAGWFSVVNLLEDIMDGSRILIFMDTKKGCDQITRQLRMDGWPALSIHGDNSQAERDWVLSEFKSGKSPIMTATDVAARGLDVKDVKYVINYDFPGSLEDYVHRIGRTGRAGATGTAYTFFTTANARFAKDLISILVEAGQMVSPELSSMGRGAPPPSLGYRDRYRGQGGGRSWS